MRANNTDLGTLASGQAADVVERAMSTGFHLPFDVRSTIHYDTGLEHILLLLSTPIDDVTSYFTFVVWRNDDFSVSAEEIIRFDLAIGAEDKRMLELLDGVLPLDQTTLVSVQADKCSVEWRRRVGSSSMSAPACYGLTISPRHRVLHRSATGAAPSEAGQRTVGHVPHRLGGADARTSWKTMRATLRPRPARWWAPATTAPTRASTPRDPDGLEFEVMWLVPAEHWGEAEHQAIIEPLDLDAESRHASREPRDVPNECQRHASTR